METTPRYEELTADAVLRRIVVFDGDAAALRAESSAMVEIEDPMVARTVSASASIAVGLGGHETARVNPRRFDILGSEVAGLQSMDEAALDLSMGRIEDGPVGTHVQIDG